LLRAYPVDAHEVDALAGERLAFPELHVLDRRVGVPPLALVVDGAEYHAARARRAGFRIID
jgi:hypothetical protein